MGMTPWQRWAERPQAVWVRKALFQVHLWTGIGIGLYVMVISISGSAIVCRRELMRRYPRKEIVVAGSGRRMDVQELEQNAQRTYPDFEVLSIREPERRDRPGEVVLQAGKKRIRRLLDPYTGTDLGNPQSSVDLVLQWLVDLHDNLLSGQTGRIVNGIGAFLVTLLGLTGAVIWWPGKKNWRRSITVNPKAKFARFNWDVHSATGFWCSMFVLVWGISGIGLCFPGTLNYVANSEFLDWLTRLHFGRFDGLTEGLWTIVGLAPAVLAVTGALMWWNRVLRKKLRHSKWIADGVIPGRGDTNQPGAHD
jgi:uncharacterized iron-regulated membrane protein